MSAPLDTWSALRHPAFRALWHSGGLYFVANAMQTMADQELEQRVRSYLLPGETVSMQHFIARR